MQKVHMSLPVKDVQVTAKFYEELFQSRPTKVKSDYVKFEPDSVPINISFMPLPSGQAAEPQRHHLGFQFPSQEALDREFARLERLNLVHGKRESSICCYADQDKFHVVDPDGYEWELYYLLSDSDLKIQADTSCCATEETACATTESVSSEASCCNE